MAREPVISGAVGKRQLGAAMSEPAERPDEETRFHAELRPQRLADVVGQRPVVERLQIMLNAARKRKEPLGHLLLDGPPGLGKTTIATVISLELDL